ncbi:MAG: HmuY family protein [Myxococcota bacterium]
MKKLTLPMTFILAACGEAVPVDTGDGAGNGSDNGSDNGEVVIEGELFRTVEEAPGIFVSQTNASDREAWVYVDIDAQEVIELTEPGDVAEWDLAFRRSNIKINGGHSGRGPVELAPMAGASFDDVTQAPVALYRVDLPAVGEVDPERPSFINDDGTDFALGRSHDASPTGWFDYDIRFHTLSGANAVFAVRSSENQYFKVRFIDYYNDAGTSGFPTFRWAPIDPPNADEATFSVDASSNEAFTYVNLETESVVEVSDPNSSMDWDLAFRRTLIRTNGGQSGGGLGGGREVTEAEGETIARDGFVLDALVPPPGPPVPMDQWALANGALSNWFDYDPETRAVSPRDTEFVAHAASGSTYRLRVIAWEDGHFEIRKWQVPTIGVVRSTTFDIDDESWTYFSLRASGEVEVEDEAVDAWDIAIRNGQIRTNGGGVLTTGEASIQSLFTAPEAGYQTDVEGLSEVMMEEAATGEVFAIRLADGTFAKIAFQSFRDGRAEFEHAFAGPATRTFR